MPSIEEIWKTAVQEDPPDPLGASGALVASLADALGVEQVEYARLGGACLFLLDLSPLHLRGMDLNVFFVAQTPKNDSIAADQAEILAEQHDATAGGLCFQVHLDESGQTYSNPHLRGDLQVIRVRLSDIRRVIDSQVPAFAFYEVVRAQLPIDRLCPYDTTREARGSMFFGRLKELRQLYEQLDTRFLVNGARRIGKTSLLLRAHQLLKARSASKDRAHYLNCITWSSFRDGIVAMAHELSRKAEARIDRNDRNLAYLLERLSKGGKQTLYLFFDEIDTIVDADSNDNWKFFKVLREASDLMWIRPVFAGFRSATSLLKSNTSPFFNRLSLMLLGPMRRSETEDLILKPLGPLGVKISAPDAFAARIWDGTAGQPFMVHYYGNHLFESAAERNERQVAIDDITQIEQSHQLTTFVLDHFLDNTRTSVGIVQAERLCAFLLARQTDGKCWTEGEFLGATQRAKHPLTLDAVHTALQNLVSANIFRFANYRYAFVLPIMRRVIRGTFPKHEVLLRTI